MSHDSHATGHAEADHGDVFRSYVIVFASLAVLTMVSYLAYVILGHGMKSLIVILLVSVVKATLVAFIFMHLKWDWGKVFGIMIPVVVMAIMMVIVLLPDMAFAPRRDTSPAALGAAEREPAQTAPTETGGS
ncbi:MAG: cytochrome C oxidase subunit IV family protein [Gemmataceae bacterium]